MRFFILVFLPFYGRFIESASSFNQSTTLKEGISYRLPNTVHPLFYNIELAPNIDEGTFKGRISIAVNVKSIVETIRLHSSNLTLTEIFLDRFESYANFSLDPQREFLDVFYTNRSQIAPGNHIIYINYDGRLKESEMGFIKAKMTYEDKVSYLAVSDFQPTYARRAFPCFDEPALKARFQVTLIAPNSSYVALSNMRQIANFHTSRGVITKFETSCVMSTYLVAFAVAPFSYGEYWSADCGCQTHPVRVRAYSVNASDENNLGPLEIVAKSINFFNNYTKFNFPLSKIDLIEYERNESGATENWGLITTKRGILSPKLGVYHISQIEGVLTHEVAHFWFGNLVTNNWWNDIWLQEGFAVFMSLKAQEHISNNSASRLFPSQYLEDVYLLDQQGPTGAVVHPVETPGDIREHFGDITYVKGAAILRMIEMVLGKNIFDMTIRHYIKKFAYKTVTTNDFINLIQDASPNVDMRSFIETYVYQNRYPLIRADETNSSYILKQTSCAFKSLDGQTPLRYKWTIPITYITDREENENLVWFHKDMDTLEIPKEAERWIKFNFEQIGFYRVIYSDSLWSKLMENHKDIDMYEKNHLLFEAVQLYLSNVIQCDVPIKFMNHLSNTKRGLPLFPAYVFLIYSEDEMKKHDEEAFTILDEHIQSLIERSSGSKKIKLRSKNHFVRPAKSGAELLIEFVLGKVRRTIEVQGSKSIPQRIKVCAEWIKSNLKQPETTPSHNDV